MNSHQAKQILLRYRPHLASDPEMIEALGLAKRDPELRDWFDQHVRVQETVREKLGGIEAPAALKQRILRRRTVVPFPWQRVVALAASIAVIAGMAIFFTTRRPSADDNSFGAFRVKMVRSVLREYRMDLFSEDLGAVRKHLATHNAPADYQLPDKLQNLRGLGGGVLSWKSRPVSMVCFDLGNKKPLFLFIVENSGVSRAPDSGSPEITEIHRLQTASWTSGGLTFVLAAPEGTDIRPFL